MSEKLADPDYPEHAAAYTEAVAAVFEKLTKSLEVVLEEGIQLPKPLPPQVVKAVIFQSIVLSAVAFAKAQGLPELVVEEVLRGINTLSKQGAKSLPSQ